MVSGGGAVEAEVSLRLSQWSKTLSGVASYCARAYAEVRIGVGMGGIGEDVGDYMVVSAVYGNVVVYLYVYLRGKYR
ncbi:hypothetical protein EON63_20215 [archaeon]|nr:MAG: hypothetical protein EON63_20215 [archaeon]